MPNTSILSFSGFKLFRFLVDTLPAMLNKCSEAELNAQMDRYFLASCDNIGKETWIIFHHSNDLLSGSGLEIVI